LKLDICFCLNVSFILLISFICIYNMNIIKKKILILGGSGFFGKNLKYLLECINYEFIFLNRNDIDVLNAEKLDTVFDTINPDIVINCCGMIGSSESNKSLKQTDILNLNLILNINIFDCCKKYAVEKLIVFSTYRILMKHVSSDFDEEYINEYFYTDLKNNNIGYLLSKSIMDSQIKLLVNESDIKITCLILPNIFGLFDNFCMNGRIVASLIYKIHNAKLDNTDLFIESNSQTIVNIIFINDIIKIIKECIYTDINCNIIILNPEGTLTLQELTNKLSEIMNFNNKIYFNDLKTYNKLDNNFVNSKLTSNLTNFKKYFHNFTFTPILHALQETVTYFISTMTVSPIKKDS